MALALGLGASNATYIHIVQPGEASWGIAKLYGVPVEDLLKENELDEESIILPGQRLEVPLDKAPGLPRWVRLDAVPLLAEPSEEARKIQCLKRRERVFYLGEKRDGFAEVLAGEGVKGWVKAAALTKKLLPSRPSARICFVTYGPARLRQGPGFEHGVVTLLPEGTKVNLHEIKGDWAKVSSSEWKVGWVHRKLLSSSPLRPTNSKREQMRQFVEVVRGPARLRQGPGKNFEVLDLIPTGARLKVVDKSGDWLKVRTLDGKVGWIAGWLVGVGGEETEKQKEESSDRGRKVVALAMRYLGVRYRRGGMTSRGMDCSGLVCRVFVLLGRNLPHRASDLYRLGKPVKKPGLKPGDLVFFRSWRGGRRIGHVGIYIGEGKFIHASSGKGEVVISNLNSGSYVRRYAGAKRLW